MNLFHKFLAALKDTFFPSYCFGCYQESNGEKICPKCYNIIFHSFVAVCQKCGRPIPIRAKCQNCKTKLDLVRVRALGLYTQPFTNLIAEFKYHNRLFLAKIFAQGLSKILLADYYLRNADFLVPVPLHKSRKRERGYNQSKILAEEIAKECGKPVLDCLIRHKNTKSQTELKGQERFENVADAFSFNFQYMIRDKKAILIDDVMTSGATLNSCAKVLLSNGAKEVYGLVVAS